MAQDPSNRRRNVARREGGCGNLIQQRLKEMVVPPIDQRDLHGGLPKRPGRI
jgi:hypothetical protein